nr:MAG TPA: Protein of unknown function (DUF2577) [Caudoviricetes sp.]
MNTGSPTGLKELIQSLMPDMPGIVEGKVTGISPLKITLVNDLKMVLSANSLVVPRHLTDYTISADLRKKDGVLLSRTKNDDGEHEHSGGNHDGHVSGDGEHTHEGGEHIHTLSTFELLNGQITVHNALKIGDIVYLLPFNGGKKYYVLDRKGG